MARTEPSGHRRVAATLGEARRSWLIGATSRSMAHGWFGWPIMSEAVALGRWMMHIAMEQARWATGGIMTTQFRAPNG